MLTVQAILGGQRAICLLPRGSLRPKVLFRAARMPAKPNAIRASVAGSGVGVIGPYPPGAQFKPKAAKSTPS
ncbi:MAG: hypothetical protein QF662_09380, partial [Phycisphaerae bacterium]|nr:hypothetical protein [Phycisphaerae bacterium]